MWCLNSHCVLRADVPAQVGKYFCVLRGFEVYFANVLIQEQMFIPEAAHLLTGVKTFPHLVDHSCHFVKLLLSLLPFSLFSLIFVMLKT